MQAWDGAAATPPVQPGSLLAQDDALTHPWQLSHIVTEMLTVAVEQLHAIKTLMLDAGMLHNHAPVTLARSAIEVSGTALLEMAYHHLHEEYFADDVFFAPPASPWLRGTNENTDGLLRQYFSKGSDLRAFTLDDLRAVEDRINRRPRRRLSWRSPAHAMEAEMAG